MRYWPLALMILLCSACAEGAFALPDTIAGTAQIHDGDSLRISDKRIRLTGVDAPELKQQCFHQQEPVLCGQKAREALSNKIDGRDVRCDITGNDRYGRYLGPVLCRWGESQCLMVAHGYALSYRQ